LGLNTYETQCSNHYKRYLLQSSQFLNQTNSVADAFTEIAKLEEQARISGQFYQSNPQPQKKALNTTKSGK